MEFTVLNWNIGGAKYLEETKDKRGKTRQRLNHELQELIKRKNPHLVTLQEIVRYGTSAQDAIDIIDPIEGYRYHSFPLIDSHRLSSKSKWNKVRRLGNWDEDTFFAQGNALLFRNDVPHFPIWDLSASNKKEPKSKRDHYIEQVNLESGLYFGDRNTEPRATLVAHFIYNPDSDNGKPLDIFVVNLHLTTLIMEREGIPEIDLEASKIRLAQLDIILRGIISRYNIWKQQGFPDRGERPKEPLPGDTFIRYEPVWILAGDFNFTENSVEYQTIKRLNFIDVVPGKGSGTKAKGVGNPATLTVDYIFAGPKFISLDHLITEDGISNNNVNHDVKGSDHYPMCAMIPLLLSK